jgi:hypothetical protein
MKVVAVWEMQSGKAGAWIYPIHLKSLPGERLLLSQVYAGIYLYVSVSVSIYISKKMILGGGRSRM